MAIAGWILRKTLKKLESIHCRYQIRKSPYLLLNYRIHLKLYENVLL